MEREVNIEDQAALLRRGVLSIIPEEGLERKLARSAETGKPLRVKLGLDPTAPDIHLGFAVVLRKLRQFQDLGHQVVIIIGDYTALIGDPSGRSATRPMLSQEQIKANAATYVEQLSVILDPARTEVRFNSEWLAPLDFAAVIRLASRMTVAQVLERDDFSERYKQGQPISLHELLYPLAQAYDSVCIEADVEMGGQDQMFNILAGRDLQRELGQDPQIGFFMPLLVGLDGSKKMSKSLGNYVGVRESPDVMFGKLMSIRDDMMRSYFELCTDLSAEEIQSILDAAFAEGGNPKDAKRRLAREIVSIYHGLQAAEAADAEFERVHARRETPSEIPTHRVEPADFAEGKAWICRVLVSAGLAKSTSEARRLVEQGGVSLDGVRVSDYRAQFSPEELTGRLLQVGSRHFRRLHVP